MKIPIPKLSTLNKQEPKNLINVLKDWGIGEFNDHITLHSRWNKIANQWIKNILNGKSNRIKNIVMAQVIFSKTNKYPEHEQNIIIRALFQFKINHLWRIVWSAFSSNSVPAHESFIIETLVYHREDILRDIDIAPQWIKSCLGSDEDLHQTLSNATKAITDWVVDNQILMNAISASSLISFDSQLMEKIIINILHTASAKYFRLHEIDSLLSFSELFSVNIRMLILNRVFLMISDADIGENVNLSRVYKHPMRTLLWLWMHKYIPKRLNDLKIWSNIGQKGISVYEYLITINEIDKIIDIFNKSPEDNRARFWSEYIDVIEDAFYYESRDGIPICMFKIKNLLIIEFGVINNACFVYSYEYAEKISSLIHSQERRKGNKIPAANFKSQKIHMGGISIQREERMTHRGDWQRKFRVKLNNLNIYMSNRLI
jgi:hypothetical protein